MKKIINIFALTASVLLMALSCVGTEGLDEIPNGEICMSPVLSDMTKTRADGVGEYPEGGSFGVFAYHSDAEGGEKWSDAGAAYFENHKFKNVDGICADVDPVYWPLDGSLIFAGYSPYEETDMAHFDVITKTFTINDYVADGTTDLMYFLPELSEGNYVGYDKSTASVPVKFYHALSCVSINVAVKSGDEANMKLKSITLKGVYTQGDFTVNTSGPTSGSWDGLTAENDIILHSSDAGTDLSTALDLECFTIPGSASVIEIVYLDRGVEKSHTIAPADHIEDWATGLKYQYNISLSVGLEPIVLNDAVFTISHNYSSGVLTGSQLSVNLKLPNEDLPRMKDVTITVSKGGVVYKTQTFDELSSNDFIITEGPKLYLPSSSGPYTVVCTYDDGTSEGGRYEVTIDSEEPEFSCNIAYVNLIGKLVITDAYVTISDDVLKEVNILSSIIINESGGSRQYEETEYYNTSRYMKNRQISLSSGKNYKFSQTYVSFDGVDEFANVNLQEFRIPSSYSIGERVELASNLEPNVKYALSLHKDQDNASRQYWSNNVTLAYQSFHIYNNYSVFIYERDDSRKDSKAREYNYSSAGAWMTAYDCTYLNDSDSFGFSETPTYFTCASVWGSEPYDANKLIVDIYCNSKSAFINRYSSRYSWQITGDNSSYKWNVYKIIDNY